MSSKYKSKRQISCTTTKGIRGQITMKNTYNEQTIAHIMQSDTFRITARSLSKELHISIQDAETELITEIIEHRHSLKDVKQRLSGRQRAEVNFAKKDLIRKQHKADNAYIKLFVPQEDNDGNDKLENVAGRVAEETSYSEDEISRALTVLPMAFQPTTAKYIEEVLTKGPQAFKVMQQWSSGYFNKQLKQWVKTSREGNAHKKLDVLLKSDTQIRHEENIQSAKSFLQMIEQDAPEEWITNWLQQSIDNKFFDPAWDVVKYQGVLLREGFSTPASRQEAYKFVNKLNEMIEG